MFHFIEKMIVVHILVGIRVQSSNCDTVMALNLRFLKSLLMTEV